MGFQQDISKRPTMDHINFFFFPKVADERGVTDNFVLSSVLCDLNGGTDYYLLIKFQKYRNLSQKIVKIQI